MFMSGVFYVVDLLTPSIRDVIVWNPLAHGIEWFRLGLYGRYLVHTLDREYLMGVAGIVLLVGITAHRATLRTLKR
jgi:capsular polysaccharide transport system permease protein